ncbi:MAG: IS66 family transposase [Mucilaginibacter sp.]
MAAAGAPAAIWHRSSLQHPVFAVNRTCQVLEPLWHLLLKEITFSGLMSLDETRYRVLDNGKNRGKKSHIGWMWACLNLPCRALFASCTRKEGAKRISGLSCRATKDT